MSQTLTWALQYQVEIYKIPVPYKGYIPVIFIKDCNFFWKTDYSTIMI